jgi:3',5'-nucleoside bisphosphate phosphatase
LKTYLADLHIHSALSPCAADEMTPPAIVAAAEERGLAMIAICDHNAAANTAAVLLAGEERIAVLAGMEVTTAEEIHVLGIFPGPISALAAADEVLETLPIGDAAYYRRFGQQRVMNAAGRLTGYEDRMLAVATKLDLTSTVELIHRHSGVAIAAHVNRPSFSVLSQLGVFPSAAGFDGVEVFAPCGGPERDPEVAPGSSVRTRTAAARRNGGAALHARPGSGVRDRHVDPRPAPYSEYGLPVVSSSDAHFLGDIARARTALVMKEPSFDEFVLALHGEGGRGVRCA